MNYKTVQIGSLLMGRDEPILIQTMTNTDTRDVEASVAQCIRLADAGADMIRLTVQGMKEVEAFRQIKQVLRDKDYVVPLIADVHFLPQVAVEAAKYAEKVRINPGNYVEKSYEGPARYSQIEQNKQVAAIAERLTPLVKVCREHGTAVRVGVNHGSLSKRILSWYGNTAQGMVESALEFIRAFSELDFHEMVISLKSSDPRVMVLANRMLYNRMHKDEMCYPMHLGVTEAGAEEDGRIRSATGIVPLLTDGIGDTIRVSLTEDPENEIPVARYLAQRYGARSKTPDFVSSPKIYFNPWEMKRRLSLPSEKVGGHHVPVVICTHRPGETTAGDFGYTRKDDGTMEIAANAPDYIYTGNMAGNVTLDRAVPVICDVGTWEETHTGHSNVYPLINWTEYGSVIDKRFGLHFIKVDIKKTDRRFFEVLDNDMYGILVAELPAEDSIEAGMRFFRMMWEINNLLPVILYCRITGELPGNMALKTAGDLGTLLLNGFGNGIWIDFDERSGSKVPERDVAFGILQSLKLRITGTEYISCPTCGRTQFNIQKTLKMVKEATTGMKGLKIGVMGCIVNGPGEMADADYGYVGAGPGKVSIYRKGDAVLTGIPEDEALERLLGLMRADGLTPGA